MAKHKYIETPEKLWEYWEEYKASRKMIAVPVMHVKLGTTILNIPEPIHERGFNVFMCEMYDMGNQSIHKYFINESGAYEEYRTTITRIKDDIFEYNYKYAAVGMHKEKLAQALLGLANKVEESGQKTFVIKDESGDTTTKAPH